jgi:hypothetical protein
VLVALAPCVAHAAQSADEQLANRYSPILALQPQEKPCGEGEPCRPTSVDIELGREGVVLRGPDGKVVKILLSIIVVGIPFAIRRFVRWSLFAQTAMLEDGGARGALRRGRELVDGYWWRRSA